MLQGLHATVNILSVELVDINSEEQCVILADKRKVQYGLLLLAVGLDTNDTLLQQQLKGHNFISSRDLLGSIAKVCAILSDLGPTPLGLVGTGALLAYWVTLGDICISSTVFASQSTMAAIPAAMLSITADVRACCCFVEQHTTHAYVNLTNRFAQIC